MQPLLKTTFTVLMADDDEDDRHMTAQVLRSEKLADAFYSVRDGEELLEYLQHRGRYESVDAAPVPNLILLDLNMPRKNGTEALAEIKNDARLKALPIVVFSTSKADEDVAETYKLGANSYVTKPDSYEGLVSVMKMMRRYWRDTVETPPHG